MSGSAKCSWRLLVADDHSLYREVLVRALESAGHSVVGQASDGEHAIRLCRQHQPDLVLMDVAMPILDGIGATKEILRIDRRQRIVMVSMHTDPLTVRHAMSSGAQGFVSKDSTFDELLRAIDRAMSGDSALSPDLEGVLSVGAESQHGSLLTEREEEVLQLLANGSSTPEIAGHLFISQKTVKNHLAAIYDKLDAVDRTQAVIRAVRLGIVRIERE